jgi:fermentation-respiration switch protein FrsA (DUF1100 family)
VRAVVLEAPVTDLRATIEFGLRRAGVPRLLVGLVAWTAARRYGLDWRAADYVAGAGGLRAPVQLFHGTSDDRVPVASSDRLAAARPDLVRYARTDAEHVGSWNRDSTSYEQAVLALLAGAAGPATACAAP